MSPNNQIFLKHCAECSACPASSCCYYEEDGFVMVGISAAKEIKEKTGLSYQEFLDFSPLPQALVEECRNDFPNSEGRMRYEMLKDNRILRLKMKNNRCPFLNEKNACHIYPFKPLICTMFPFWYKTEEAEIKIVPHNPQTDCLFMENEKCVPDELHTHLKKVALAIEEEKEEYLKEIEHFVKENKLI